MKTLLFVCTGNSCRSPMAEAIAADRIERDPRLSGEWEAASAGTMAAEGGAMTDLAGQALEALRVPGRRHCARRLTPAIVAAADMILAMEARQLDEINAAYPGAAHKTHTLKGFAEGVLGRPGDRTYDIRDPFLQPLDVYLESARHITGAVEAVLHRLAGGQDQ